MMSNDGEWTLETFPIPEMLALPRNHTFADAMQALCAVPVLLPNTQEHSAPAVTQRGGLRFC